MKNLRGVRPAELRDLYRTLIRQGAVLSMTGGNHVRIALPNGRTVTASLSASTPQAARTTAQSVRRYGRWDAATGTDLSED